MDKKRIERPWPGGLTPNDRLMLAIFGAPPEWKEELAALEAKAKAEEEDRLWAVARGWQAQAVTIKDDGRVFSATLYGEDGIGFANEPLSEGDITITQVRTAP